MEKPLGAAEPPVLKKRAMNAKSMKAEPNRVNRKNLSDA